MSDDATWDLLIYCQHNTENQKASLADEILCKVNRDFRQDAVSRSFSVPVLLEHFTTNSNSNQVRDEW